MKKTFYFAVTETFNKIVKVEAENHQEAYLKVDNAFAEDLSTLTPEDFVDREIWNVTLEVERDIQNGYDASDAYEEVK
jgi:hypothetical protein